MLKSVPWWKSNIAYQIYPRSFCDSNNDGIGDIPGIISKLDYLKDLGIGIIWLSPVYRSPNNDNGYDISGYREINPEYGTLQDMKNLIQEAKKRNIKIIMDLVINHTSDEHPWFIESKKNIENPYRSYYIWKKGKTLKNGKKIPPNNWTSFFTGSAWEYDEKTDEYYLHLFSKKQPDLNYNNPDVLSAIKDIMKFWLDMGIAGFRCDVINVIYKTSLENGKKRIACTGREWYLCQAGCHKILQELRKDVLSKYDCFAVGETTFVNIEEAKKLCNSDNSELDMIFNFEHVECDQINNKWFKTKFKPAKFMSILEKWQEGLDWNALYLENHDQPRSISRFGNKKYYLESGKMLATLLLTLRGTPFIFEGEEIGMKNINFDSISDFKDLESHNIWNLGKKLHFPEWLILKMLRKTSRDNARTPMQWNSSKNAGFSENEKTNPWIKIGDTNINVASQLNNPESLLNWYKKLINIRKNTPELTGGSFEMLYKDKNVFAYKRKLQSITENESRECIIVLNFSKKKRLIPEKLKNHINLYKHQTVLCSIYPSIEKLPPYAAFIIENLDRK